MDRNMKRFSGQTSKIVFSTLLSIGFGMGAMTADAQRFGGTVTSAPIARGASTFTTAVDFAETVETSGERSSSFDAGAAGGGTAGTFEVVVDRRLAVNGTSSGGPLVVDATPKSFDDWEGLFDFLEEDLAASPVRNEAGEVIGVSGKYTRTGNVIFDDDGEQFQQLDYIAAYLGGIDGEMEVDGEMISLSAGVAGPNDPVFYSTDTEQSCDDTGENCVEGHSWVSHKIFYHSVGARTKQTVGGYETITTYVCTSGVPVRYQGRRQCRTPNRDAMEFDKELKAWVPNGSGGELYLYHPLSPRYHEAFRNELRVGARVLIGPTFPLNLAPVIKPNEKEVEIGEWLILRSVTTDEFGNPFALPDVTGVCGAHSSNKGGYVQTSDGSTGDYDILCEGGVPY